jgi:hypothetical protein
MWKTSCVVVALIVGLVQGNRFANHERVPLVANTVGPFNNPTETYPVSEFIFTSLIHGNDVELSTIIFPIAEEPASSGDTSRIWARLFLVQGKC